MLVSDGAARTGIVTGLTAGETYVGVVVALEITEDGFEYLYNWDGPVTVSTARDTARVSDFQSLSAGDDHTCGVRADSSVVCWGHNGRRTPAISIVYSSPNGINPIGGIREGHSFVTIVYQVPDDPFLKMTKNGGNLVILG